MKLKENGEDNMIDLKGKLEVIAGSELQMANEKYPLFASAHEGYAVLLEEFEEAIDEIEDLKTEMEYTWRRIKGNRGIEEEKIYNFAIAAAAELIQVAAMAKKFEMSIDISKQR
jgi:hypothetical protein